MTLTEALKVIDDFAAYEILTPDAWAGRVLAAEIRRRDAMRCGTCRHQWVNSSTPDWNVCGRVSVWGHSVAQVRCSFLGGGCLAWEGRDEQ